MLPAFEDSRRFLSQRLLGLNDNYLLALCCDHRLCQVVEEADIRDEVLTGARISMIVR